MMMDVEDEDDDDDAGVAESQMPVWQWFGLSIETAAGDGVWIKRQIPVTNWEVNERKRKKERDTNQVYLKDSECTHKSTASLIRTKN